MLSLCSKFIEHDVNVQMSVFVLLVVMFLLIINF
ncbi:hypothetical protein CPS_1212 [Colwellia psychrerythraea 34H]|uniref:Uncharacterized protein n=1 Tax=Colwellia psychrerythraea (strain 34H / ATCC BAA-681) TaxID=167879 RepID=Q486R0_COLP3|nr:hypothetical protein CPS_1212 [Colwellia psychrerythraea 34H]